MKYITNTYIDNNFKYDLVKSPINMTKEYTDITPTLVQYAKEIALVKIFTDKYTVFMKEPNIAHDTTHLDKYIEYVKEQTNILTYKYISNSFVDDYIMVYDNANVFRNKKNILMFNTGVNFAEAILYYNTIMTHFKSTKYYIINEHDTNIDKKDFDLLIKYYDGEDIIIESANQSHASELFISKYLPKKIDLVLLDIRRLTNKYYENHYILYFAIIVITLSILQKNGTFIFYQHNLSINFMKTITYILAKYFKSIYLYVSKITDKHYFICDGFIGSIDKHDTDLFKKILQELGKIESKDIHVSRFIDYEEKDIVENHITDYYHYLERVAEKQVKLYNKYIKTINELTSDILIEHRENVINRNFYKVTSLCHKYKLVIDNTYAKKYDVIVDSISELFVYSPIEYFGTSIIEQKAQKFVKIVDPNNLIKMNNQKSDITDNLKGMVVFLNANKIGIDSRNPKKWNNITRDLNISQYLIKYINEKYHINISRAFLKMYEMLYTFNPIKSNSNITPSGAKPLTPVDKLEFGLTTLHICEAPGHFINATSHYIKSKYPNINHTWFANSLNPYNKENQKKYGNILSDMYGFIKNYPKNWLWGADNTGDITHTENIQFFKDNYENKIDLITSDCGLETGSRIEYFTQESTMLPTNFAQIFIALIVLKRGGSGIFKFFFPFSRPLTISLIQLLSLFFEQLYISKPNTSSPTNNEIYFIAINKKYDLTEANYTSFKNFLNNFDNETNLFSPEEINDLFISQIEKIVQHFIYNQINQLNTIYQMYDNDVYFLEIKNSRIANAQQSFATKWVFVNNFRGVGENVLGI